MNRYNIFNQIHKGLRSLLYETALLIQRTDFLNKEESKIALDRVKEVVELFEKHAHTEDTYVLPALTEYEPAVVNVFEEEHVKDHELSEKLLSYVYVVTQSQLDDTKVEMGRALSIAYVEFMIFNLNHMAKEETQQKAPAQEGAGWHYQPTDDAPAGDADTKKAIDTNAVAWSASEFVAHEKRLGWYALLGAVAVVVSALLYLLTHDVVSVVVVLVMAMALGAAGSRKPRVVEYRLDSIGLSVGGTLHPYDKYKSFFMPEEGPFSSVVLIPMKHLSFPISAYLAPENQEHILEVLSSHLPMERGKLDSVERLMRRLRF